MREFPFKYHRIILALLTVPFVNGSAGAEEVEEVRMLPEIMVTASPWQEDPVTKSSIVDPDLLQSLRPATSDTASLLKFVPGVSIQDSGGVSSLPVIRGLADDRVRIKVDGMDLISACGNHMNPPLSYIDPTNVGDVKVFAGISPVSVGGDSIGGAILVDSPAPEFAKSGEGLLRKGEIGAFYRSNGNVIGGNASVTVANESVSLSYRGSIVEADNYKAGEDFKPAGPAAAGKSWLDGDEVGSTMYESMNQSLSFGMLHENHLVGLTLGLQDIPNQGWPNQRMDMTDNDSTQINLRYEGQFDWGELETRVYHERTRHEMQFGEDKLFWYASPDGVACTPSPGMMGCAEGMPMDTEGKNSGLVIKVEKELSDRDLLRFGGEAQLYDLDDWWDPSGKGMWPDVFWNIKDGERDRLALFSEWEAEWNPRWMTQLGVRAEQVDMDAGEVQGYSAAYAAESAAFNAADRSKTDHNLDLTALARFTPDDTKTLEFGYAQKTRSPNLYERYTWSTGGMVMQMINMAGDGNGYVGNLDLKPEVAHIISGTIDLHDAAEEKWGLKLTPYVTYVDDFIDAARCSSANSNCDAANQTVTDAFVYLQFVNQSALLYGIDISGHYPLAEDTSYGDLTATGVVSYVRGKNDTTNDNLYNIMPLNAKFAVVQTKDAWTNTIEVELVDEKTDVSAVRNELKTSGYGLLNLRGRYEWKQVSIDFGVENVFDKFYNHPLGGAYTGQGKTMSATGVAWGTSVPGMGRSFYAGVNYKF